jgi:hypothetical protein
VLRPGAGLRCKQELATAARAWRPADDSGIRGARGRAAGEGNRAGAGGERHVAVIPAGDGAAAAAERRLGAKHCRWHEGEQSRGARARGRRREGRGSGGLFENFRNLRDLWVN